MPPRSQKKSVSSAYTPTSASTSTVVTGKRKRTSVSESAVAAASTVDPAAKKRKSESNKKGAAKPVNIKSTQGPTTVRLQDDDEEMPQAPRDRYPDKSVPDLLGCASGIRSFALSYPDASEHFPWKHRVIKVSNKKIFLFLDGDAGATVGLGVKLTLENQAEAKRKFPGLITDPGYGMWKSGWIGVKVNESGPVAGEPSLKQLKQWIDESYRNLAKKTLIKQIQVAI